MAGHGGESGGHGGGGGKKGVVSTVAGNGCLRYLAFYVIALFLLIGGLVANSLHLIPHLPGLAAGASSTGGATTQSVSVAAPPSAAQNSAPASNAIQPASNTSAAPAGGGVVAQSGANGSQGGGSVRTAPAFAINGAPVAGAQGALITPYNSPAFYIVQPGDTLDTIAATYGTTAANLRAYNQLNSDILSPGMVLYLPPVAYNPVPSTGRNAGHDSAPASDPSNGDGTPH